MAASTELRRQRRAQRPRGAVELDGARAAQIPADLAQRLRESAPRRVGQLPRSGPETLIERSAYLPQTPPRGWREQAGGGLHARRSRPPPSPTRRCARRSTSWSPRSAPPATSPSMARCRPARSAPRRCAGDRAGRRRGDRQRRHLADGRGAPEAPRAHPGRGGHRRARPRRPTRSRQPPAARYDAATGTLLVPELPAARGAAAERWRTRSPTPSPISASDSGVSSRLAPDGARASTATPRARAWRSSKETPCSPGSSSTTRARISWGRTRSARCSWARRAGRRRASAAGRLPFWFGELGQFTHVDGLLFVARVRAHRPWSAVDALWSEPPASSEQILHPEKYDACEATHGRRRGALSRADRDSGARPASDVLGELVVRTWLESALPPGDRRRAPRPAGAEIARDSMRATPSAPSRRRGRRGRRARRSPG